MTDRETRVHNRISKLGMVVLVMAMISLIVVLWTSYQDRRDTQCQKDLNTRFLTVVKQRATIADGDREAVRQLVRDLVAAGGEESEVAEVLSDYDAANTALDKAREKVEYPSEDLCR